MIIALDGPAGSGKSSVAKELASKLKIEYLDTGSMYRALSWYLLENDLTIEELVAKLNSIDLKINQGNIFLNQQDITNKIRTEAINQTVSLVAANEQVRQYLVEQQRLIAKEVSTILDGRDIGTVVFPNADFKFYIDASSSIRAKRRVQQNQELGLEADYQTIKESIEKRDYQDENREFGALKKAQDAIYIDTSDLTIEKTIEKIMMYIKGE